MLSDIICKKAEEYCRLSKKQHVLKTNVMTGRWTDAIEVIQTSIV